MTKTSKQFVLFCRVRATETRYIRNDGTTEGIYIQFPHPVDEANGTCLLQIHPATVGAMKFAVATFHVGDIEAFVLRMLPGLCCARAIAMGAMRAYFRRKINKRNKDMSRRVARGRFPF